MYRMLFAALVLSVVAVPQSLAAQPRQPRLRDCRTRSGAAG
jgi:hypothetical protein